MIGSVLRSNNTHTHMYYTTKEDAVGNLIDTKGLSHEQWLEYRQAGIGGSDAGAICGLNPYRSRVDVWIDKTAKKPVEKPDNEALRVGRDLEDYVARRFTEETGKKVRRNNHMMFNDTYPFMIANIDREVIGENAILECKTANAYGADRWADDKVPESYELQCHHYMAVTGADRVYIACLIMGISFVVRTVERDEDVINSLIQIESEFWNDYVIPKTMPAPDGSDSYDRQIAEIYPEAEKDKETDLDADYIEKLRRYDEIEELKHQLDEEENAIKQEIKLAMDTSEVAWAGDRRITWRNTKPRVTIDSKRLLAELPEIFEQYSKTTKPSRRFMISKPKEETNE